MCFSPEVDAVAGILVGGVGIDTLRHVRERREIPLGVLPALFAAHQITEAFVWWGLEGKVGPGIGRSALWIYVVFALGVLPVLVPLAIRSIEPQPGRRRMMALLAGLGAAVSLVLMVTVVHGPLSAQTEPYHLSYHIGVRYGALVTVLYVVATCWPALLSSYRHIVVYGALNLAAVVLIGWLTVSGFISLWCVWAAVTSIAIDMHLRRAHRPGPVPSAFA